MTHEGVFLADILANPGDDFPRLAFADYLEETGRDPARAEFIRCQVALADPTVGPCACFPSRWGEYVYECRGCALRRREYELRGDERFPFWCPRAVADTVMASTYRRGFVESVTLPTALFLEHAAALFRAAPITEVRLTDREPGRIGDRHYWLRAAVYAGQPWRIPDEIAHAMNAAERRAGHATPEAAHAYLSTACVTLGRRLAGLPALTPI